MQKCEKSIWGAAGNVHNSKCIIKTVNCVNTNYGWRGLRFFQEALNKPQI